MTTTEYLAQLQALKSSLPLVTGLDKTSAMKVYKDLTDTELKLMAVILEPKSPGQLGVHEPYMREPS